MDATTHQRWLADSRRFWNAADEFEARYRRICASEPYLKTDESGRLESLWHRDTEESIALILKNIPIEPDWVCLEIGCGVGRLLKPMAGRCARAIGVDLSPNMVGWARNYLSDTPNAEVILNDGTSLARIPDGGVTFVFSHLAFQHITREDVVDAYLAEISRVLKPGGYCRIQCWAESRRSAVEFVKDIGRAALGRPRYKSERYWSWRPGREVAFGGITHRPSEWNRRLRSAGLTPLDTTLGVGHEVWMWSTSRKK